MILLSLYVLLLIKRLYEALDRAEAANQAKRVFVSSVSHELRTPLNAIIGMNDLLRATTLTTEQAEMARTMHSASRVMLSLVEDVLDFSKIEAGKLTIESVDFDLHALIQSTVTIFSRQAEMKGVRLGVFVMPDVAPALKGGAHHLQQVLVNLIGNAVKFTERGEIQVTVSVLTEDAQSVRLRFAVRDTGIGIPLEDQQRIFESFAQTASPGVRKHRGTGLGTTISKRLVELMGGVISLQSAPGAGSTFWFDLPFQKQDTAAAESPTSLRGSRALLVGFPEAAQRALAADLRQWEMESGSAANLAGAAVRLNEAVTLGHPYRIALLYADSADADIARMAAELRERDDGDSLGLILCAPRNIVSLLGARMPAEFTSVIGLPPEKRLLYNALHSVLAGENATVGAISLADYYRDKEPARSCRILVADDDRINRKVIAQQLELAGHIVELAADGVQALDALDRADYDVVILDSNMPLMSGLEATRLIRVMQAGRAGVPIIMFSADATPETIQEATDAGVDVFLPKPIEAGKLFSTIEQLTEKRPRDTAKVVQAIAPPQPAALLINISTLRGLERMSQDPQFVRHLADMFTEDTSKLAIKIEEALARHHHEDFKSYVHALKGTALNIGAERLFAHCNRLRELSYPEREAAASTLAAETRSLTLQTQAALAEYVKNRSAAGSY